MGKFALVKDSKADLGGIVDPIAFGVSLQMRSCIFKSQSMVSFSRSPSPSFTEKRRSRLRLEIKIAWHSKCNRLYRHYYGALTFAKSYDSFH